MGLDINGVRFLLFAKAQGADFSRTAMIGRQELHLTVADLKSSLVNFEHPFDEEAIDSIFGENRYAEEFLKLLGAGEIHSFDHSNYEGATYLHDMNQEIPSIYRKRYSVVRDGGSLEHVFNFPQSVKNCMEMVEVGGHYLGISPANNFFGHGFYQFSPELFFAIFRETNGFELVHLIAFEINGRDTTWFSVQNPDLVKGRVTLRNSAPVYLLIVAKKNKVTTIFETTPQQSDYISTWTKPDSLRASGPSTARKSHAFARTVARAIPNRVRRALKELFGANIEFNPQFFRPIDPVRMSKASRH